MAGFEMRTNEHLNRTEFWSDTLKSLALDELYANKFVRQLSLPSDIGSSVYNIPSLGEAEVADFVEGQRIKYNKFDTGNYTFEIDQYKYSANSISAQFKMDSHWAPEVLASFIPRQHRAIMVDYETRIFQVANDGQTASNLNTINDGDHRYVGTGTNQTFAFKDAARAQYAIRAANMPMTNLTAIVDPSVIYTIQTQANVTNLMTPTRGSIISNNTPTGTKFEMSIFGFDFYSSNYLPRGITETIDGATVTTNGVANFFFSAAPGDTLPWVGAWVQMPTVYSEFNKDAQEWEYFTICRYGVQGDFRPENLVTILTDRSQIS